MPNFPFRSPYLPNIPAQKKGTALVEIYKKAGIHLPEETADSLDWIERIHKSYASKEGNSYNYITDYDISNNFPGWKRKNLSSPIWPNACFLSLEEFWSLFYTEFRTRTPHASFLKTVPPLPDHDKHIKRASDEVLAQLWQRKISAWSDWENGKSLFPINEPVDIRVSLSPTSLSFQKRAASEESFYPLKLHVMNLWLDKNFPEPLTEAAKEIIFFLKDYKERNSYVQVSLGFSRDTFSLVLKLLRSCEPGCVLLSGETPLKLSPHPISWTFEESEDSCIFTPVWNGAPTEPNSFHFFKQGYSGSILAPGIPYCIHPPSASLVHIPHGRDLFLEAGSSPSSIPKNAFPENKKTQLIKSLIGYVPEGLLTRPPLPLKANFCFSPDSEWSPEIKRGICYLNVSAIDTAKKEWASLDFQGWKSIENSDEKNPPADFLFPDSRIAFTAMQEFSPDWSHTGWKIKMTKKFIDNLPLWLKRWQSRFIVEAEGALADFLRPPLRGKLSLNISEKENDWFDLEATLSFDDIEFSAEEIRILLKAKGSFVEIPGKGWHRMETAIQSEDAEKLAKLGLGPEDVGGGKQRFHAIQLWNARESDLFHEEAAVAIREKISSVRTSVDATVPDGLKAELRPYQIEGFRFLAYLSTNGFGGILADDMGLGKTMQAIAWLLWLRGKSDPRPSLVVCPKSVAGVWMHETAKFAPDLPVTNIGDSPKSWQKAAKNGALIIANYAQLRTQATEIGSIHWQAVILDEAQAIKNPNSQIATVARALRADHRVALTGTPIENRLLDIWSIYAFAMPGILGTRAAFTRSTGNKENAYATSRLSSRIKPFFLRRTKQQVATDLPERTEEELFCSLEKTQLDLYRAELKRARQHLLGIESEKQFDKERFHLLTSLLRLRQICAHPKLAKLGFSENPEDSAKTAALLEQLATLFEEGEKAVVFSQWVEMLAILQPLIEEQGWKVFLLTGQTENRGPLVEAFQSHDGPAVFLISLKAGGSGLTLTAASYVFLYDPWWNPAVEAQAIDRTHRIGQTQPVFAYRLLAKDTVEEKIRKLQSKKLQVAAEVTGSGGFGESLSLDDFRYLFNE